MQLYRSYAFKPTEKDPVITRVLDVLGTPDTDKNAATESGVSPSTLSNWRRPVSMGGTRRPQFCTIAAVLAARGYEITFIKRRGKLLP